MAISSIDQYVAAAKQRADYVKTGARTTVAAQWFSAFDLAGSPGAGTLAGVDAAAGVVPIDTVAGYPPINTFGGGATGYLSRIDFSASVAMRVQLFDRLFVAGAYAFNAATVLAAQPSYAGRCPAGDFKGLQIWAETVTAATLNQAWTVTYTNEAGSTGRTTGAIGIAAAPTVGRCFQLPLQAGDAGVSVIESVTGTVGSAGTANIMVLRPLWQGRINFVGDGSIHDLLRLGMPQIYDTSALYMLIAPDSTALGVPSIGIEVANA